jgi:hypothetical protein
VTLVIPFIARNSNPPSVVFEFSYNFGFIAWRARNSLRSVCYAGKYDCFSCCSCVHLQLRCLCPCVRCILSVNSDQAQARDDFQPYECFRTLLHRHSKVGSATRSLRGAWQYTQVACFQDHSDSQSGSYEPIRVVRDDMGECLSCHVVIIISL